MKKGKRRVAATEKPTKPDLTPDQLDDLANALMGTSNLIERALESIGLDDAGYDVSELEERLLEANIPVERCQGCDWWFECSELDGGDNEENIGYCDQCCEDLDSTR